MGGASGWWFSKFSWNDWLADSALSLCSPEARGVWMDLLAHAHGGTPVGHLTVGGRAPSIKQLAKMGRCNPRRMPKLLQELEDNGVFSRTPDGIIYSRRIVRDFNAFQVARNNGKRGGNPVLTQGYTHHADEIGVKLEREEETTKELHTERVESERDATPPQRAISNGEKGAHLLPDNWRPTQEQISFAESLGLDAERTAEDFRDHWLGAGGNSAYKRDWGPAWRKWCRNDHNCN